MRRGQSQDSGLEKSWELYFQVLRKRLVILIPKNYNCIVFGEKTIVLE